MFQPRISFLCEALVHTEKATHHRIVCSIVRPLFTTSTFIAINDHDETHFPISVVALRIDVERGDSGSEEASTSEVAAKRFDVNV
jgi:hypothetical protein